MDTDWKEKVIVAAIDFGTACTGCAISYKADYLKKKENMITPYWHSGGSLRFGAYLFTMNTNKRGHENEYIQFECLEI
ncbi:hypothetical protein DPMN_157785 [Dreissena polymorpha]|uniref:Uncharacterized protein n=1 Tax=Dreissena polymorpha TaxID=45954 RepID=A0A9D4ILD1_DREPO|nr:hypothetical protein DPMN_157785 [Dreissena polymorpha]